MELGRGQISPGSDLCTAQSRQPVNATNSFSLSRARRAEKFWRTAPLRSQWCFCSVVSTPHEWIEISIRNSLWRFRSRDYEITKPCVDWDTLSYAATPQPWLVWGWCLGVGKVQCPWQNMATEHPSLSSKSFHIWMPILSLPGQPCLITKGYM